MLFLLLEFTQTLLFHLSKVHNHTQGCLHYWLVEKKNVNYHSFCPKQGEQLIIPSQGMVQIDLSSIALSLSTQRNETQQQLNVNTHLPAKTVIVENTLNLSWAEFEPKQTLKAIYLDNQLLSSISAIGNKVSLPVKEKAGWQKWMIILSNGSRYSGQVKKLSPLEFSAISQEIKSLNVVEPKGLALSRAFIFLDNQLYLNAWQVFYTLYQEEKSTGISHLLLATELAMGRATHNP